MSSIISYCLLFMANALPPPLPLAEDTAGWPFHMDPSPYFLLNLGFTPSHTPSSVRSHASEKAGGTPISAGDSCLTLVSHGIPISLTCVDLGVSMWCNGANEIWGWVCLEASGRRLFTLKQIQGGNLLLLGFLFNLCVMPGTVADMLQT